VDLHRTVMSLNRQLILCARGLRLINLLDQQLAEVSVGLAPEELFVFGDPDVTPSPRVGVQRRKFRIKI